MNRIINWTFGSFFRTLGRVFVYLLLGFILFKFINFNDIKLPNFSDLLFINVNALEGLTNSGDSLKGSAKIGSSVVGSNYYYEFNSGTYDSSVLDLHFITELNPSLMTCNNVSCSGTTDVNFYVDYCVNGSMPTFAIWSTYLNNVEYSYSLNSSIYLSNGEWSRAQCYRSFISLNLNYLSSCNTQGLDCLTTYTENNNTFALLGDYGYNVLLRYNDLVYLNAGDYTTLLNQAKQEGANNTIIDQNTTIINNQTNNTNSIINNQNSNTDREIDSQRVCSKIDKTNIIVSGFLRSSDGEVSPHSGSGDSSRGVTDFIKIYSSSVITNLRTNGSNSSDNLCFYNVNKSPISCVGSSSYNNNDNIDIPSNASYVRFTISSNLDRPQFNICTNGNQAIGDNLNDINNSLTDDSPPTNLDSLNNSAGWLPAGPVDSILNLPLSFLTNLNTNLSKSCQPVNLPLPYINKNLPLPCVNTLYNEITGLPNWINIIGTIASAFILFGYFINLYKYVDDTLTFRENNYIDNWSGV